MRQSIGGVFPPAGHSQGVALNLQDTGIFPGTTPINSAKTLGVTSYVQPIFPDTSPRPDQVWNFLSLTVQGYIAIMADNRPTVISGKLGKIHAGVILEQFSGSLLPNYAPLFTQKVDQLPSDQGLLSVLFDPAVDEMPPLQLLSGGPFVAGDIDQNLAHYLPVSASVVAPVPVQIKPGVPPTVGIWMFPSIWTNNNSAQLYCGMILVQCTYTVTYDDGLGPLNPQIQVG